MTSVNCTGSSELMTKGKPLLKSIAAGWLRKSSTNASTLKIRKIPIYKSSLGSEPHIF